jgi:hypothetical protein
MGQKEDKARRKGFQWAEKEVGKMAGWAAFLLIPIFFSEFFSSYFCHWISGKKRIEIGKGLGSFAFTKSYEPNKIVFVSNKFKF